MVAHTDFQRIVIVGSSCAGKTTLAAQLANLFDLPHIELDSLFWELDWKQAATEEFRVRVAQTMFQDKWVMDGNYPSKIGDMLMPDLIVWLDPLHIVVLWRFSKRTLKRTMSRDLLWGHSRESLKNSIFNKNPLLLWIIKTRRRKAKGYEEVLRKSGSGTKAIRLSSNQEIEIFLASLPLLE